MDLPTEQPEVEVALVVYQALQSYDENEDSTRVKGLRYRTCPQAAWSRGVRRSEAVRVDEPGGGGSWWGEE